MASIDMLSRINADAAVLRTRLQDLTQQTTTGLRSQQLGDLGTDLPRALNVKAAIHRGQTYTAALDTAAARASATQGVLGQLQDIASRFADTVALKLDPNDTAGITRAATEAKAALRQVAGLLNSQQDGQYIFGGTDLAHPPIPDAENIGGAGFAAQIATAVSGLGGGNAATVLANAVSTASSNVAGVTPFSAFLSDPSTGLTEPRRAVPAADGQVLPYGVAANRNAAATSTGTTTGSWARDLVGGLATLASLSPGSATSPADFRQLATGITGWLKGAENALADESGALGQSQAQIDSAKTAQAHTVTALTSQLSGAQEVDMATTITRLQATQTTLQASYTAIGQLAGLSLAQFLR